MPGRGPGRSIRNSAAALAHDQYRQPAAPGASVGPGILRVVGRRSSNAARVSTSLLSPVPGSACSITRKACVAGPERHYSSSAGRAWNSNPRGRVNALMVFKSVRVHDPPPLLPALLALAAGPPGKIIPRISRIRGTRTRGQVNVTPWLVHPVLCSGNSPGSTDIPRVPSGRLLAAAHPGPR